MLILCMVNITGNKAWLKHDPPLYHARWMVCAKGKNLFFVFTKMHDKLWLLVLAILKWAPIAINQVWIVLSENSVFQKFSVSSLKKGAKIPVCNFNITNFTIYTKKKKRNSQKHHRCKICPKIKKNSGGEWGAAFKNIKNRDVATMVIIHYEI